MTENAIEIQDLEVWLSGTPVLDRLTMTVPAESIYGLLGVNGAGKTTAIRSIMGHVNPVAGTVRVWGRAPWEHNEATRRRVAYVSENMMLPGWMTPRGAIQFCQRSTPQWDSVLCEQLLEDFGLAQAGQFRTLSKGQKRKLCALLALCRRADLLVMDEPVSGLDTVARRGFLNRILDMAIESGATVLISSHILPDLERVVDRVGLIHGGRMRIESGLDDLKESVREVRFDAAVTREDLERHFQVLQFAGEPRSTTALVTDFQQERLKKLCDDLGTEPASVQGMNLEDLFVALTGSAGQWDEAEGEDVA